MTLSVIIVLSLYPHLREYSMILLLCLFLKQNDAPCPYFSFFPYQKPTSGESCTLSLGCSVGYVCDQNLKTCRLPQLSETCFNTCANGYTCRNDTNTCYLPIENEACVSSMGCQIGYICKSYGTGLTLCEVSIFS